MHENVEFKTKVEATWSSKVTLSSGLITNVVWNCFAKNLILKGRNAGIYVVAQWVKNTTSTHEDADLIPALGQWVKYSALQLSVGHRCSTYLVLLWLWQGPAAAALICPLAWELPYAVGASIKSKYHPLHVKRNYKITAALGHNPNIAIIVRVFFLMAALIMRNLNYMPKGGITTHQIEKSDNIKCWLEWAIIRTWHKMGRE